MKRFFFTSVILNLLTSILLSFNVHAQNEFVDLGLSVTWATCNVGANSPEENGEYYTFDNALTLKKNEERLPTKEEFQELIDNCTWLWTEEGVHGYMATSKKNGNSIFLPAASTRYGTSVELVGSHGGYWSSSTDDGSDFVAFLYFCIFDVSVGFDDRSLGRSVRLVQDAKK
jgi:uncharacterized protein (TIGR02145 family)